MKRSPFFILAIWVVVCPLLLVVCLNIAVDPYDELGIRRWVKQPLVETTRTEKPRRILTFSSPRDAIVLGSSRMMEVDPSTLSQSAYNLSVDSALPEDFLALLRWLDQHEALPRLILMGIDFNMFNGAIATDARLRHALPLWSLVSHETEMKEFTSSEPGLLSPFWRRYLSRAMALDSIRAMRLAINPTKARSDTTANGMLRRNADLATRSKQGWRVRYSEEKMSAYLNEKFGGFFELSAARQKLFEKCLDLAARKGIHVALVLTPYHPDVLERIDRDPALRRLLSATVSYLNYTAEARGLEFFDATRLDSIPCLPEQMWDFVHPMPECANRLANRVLKTTSAR